MTTNHLLVALAGRLASITALKDEVLDGISNLEFELNALDNSVAILEDDLREARKALSSGLCVDPPQHPHAETEPGTLCACVYANNLFRFVKAAPLAEHGEFESLDESTYVTRVYNTMHLLKEE